MERDMNTRPRNLIFPNRTVDPLRLIGLLALLYIFARQASAQPVPPGSDTNYYYGTPLQSFSFSDTNYWTSDFGVYPNSFYNLASSPLGDGTALVVDSGDPALLQYNVTEETGTNNLSVGPSGSVFLWFAPTSWSGTNHGGTGPGVWGRLLEVGDESSGYGRWSLYVDPDGVNLYFTVQTNGGPAVTYLSAPIEWWTNRWHSIALTYTPTNSILYLDGYAATNGPGITNFPGSEVTANGLFIGSDNNGNNQAHGMFDDITTYDYPLSANTVAVADLTGEMYLLLNPRNPANWAGSAPSAPSSNPNYNVITGAGYLHYLGASDSCVTSSNVWMTNVNASATSQPMTFNFTIAGGTYGLMYDIFATPALTLPITNGLWSWMGQGGTCSRYSIPNLPTLGSVLFILGTSLDSDGDGLTDAYELLVSHSNPNVVDTDGNGMPDGWQVLNFGKIGNNPTGDPDQDGLTNLKEYLYGTNPNVSEGINPWVGEPAIFVSVP
jgi:hypothetical protein